MRAIRLGISRRLIWPDGIVLSVAVALHGAAAERAIEPRVIETDLGATRKTRRRAAMAPDMPRAQRADLAG